MTRRPAATAPAKVNWAAPKLKGLTFGALPRNSLGLLVYPQGHPEPKPAAVGKKEAAQLEAQNAHEESGWGELLH